MPIETNDKRRKLLLVLGAMLTARVSGAHAADTPPIKQPQQRNPTDFIERAFEMRRLAVESGDQGYGAVVVRAGVIVGQAPSHVVLHADPTAHAEMEAIRDAAHRLGSRDLGGCILYSSSPPCPMCEAAAYWAGIEKMVFGSSAEDGGSPRLCG